MFFYWADSRKFLNVFLWFLANILLLSTHWVLILQYLSRWGESNNVLLNSVVGQGPCKALDTRVGIICHLNFPRAHGLRCGEREREREKPTLSTGSQGRCSAGQKPVQKHRGGTPGPERTTKENQTYLGLTGWQGLTGWKWISSLQQGINDLKIEIPRGDSGNVY